MLSQHIGHYLTIKQILDEKNNLSIVEKIDQLKNLIKCMRNKIDIIDSVNNMKKAVNNNAENLNNKSNIINKYLKFFYFVADECSENLITLIKNNDNDYQIISNI